MYKNCLKFISAHSSLLPQDSNGCPYLFLAPMEGVGDRTLRKSLAQIGGMDEMVTEFISVPANAHVQSLSKVYDPKELGSIPLAAQIMGSDPDLMAAMAIELAKRGAPRVDINCGCPSNTVTGRGAGSSLLKNPRDLYEVAQAVVRACPVPTTLKMRSGYQDTSLFKENVLAAEESGVRFITLHPRTKVEGYSPPANWSLIALAKELVQIPVVGNGDILTVEDALQVLSLTRCDALMIGRGAIINPFLFLEIRSHFSKTSPPLSWDALEQYLRFYYKQFPQHLPEKTKINKLKQLLGFLCKSSPSLLEKRQALLTQQAQDSASFLEAALPVLKNNFSLS